MGACTSSSRRRGQVVPLPAALHHHGQDNKSSEHPKDGGRRRLEGEEEEEKVEQEQRVLSLAALTARGGTWTDKTHSAALENDEFATERAPRAHWIRVSDHLIVPDSSDKPERIRIPELSTSSVLTLGLELRYLLSRSFPHQKGVAMALIPPHIQPTAKHQNAWQPEIDLDSNTLFLQVDGVLQRWKQQCDEHGDDDGQEPIFGVKFVDASQLLHSQRSKPSARAAKVATHDDGGPIMKALSEPQLGDGDHTAMIEGSTTLPSSVAHELLPKSSTGGIKTNRHAEPARNHEEYVQQRDVSATTTSLNAGSSDGGGTDAIRRRLSKSMLEADTSWKLYGIEDSKVRKSTNTAVSTRKKNRKKSTQLGKDKRRLSSIWKKKKRTPKKMTISDRLEAARVAEEARIAHLLRFPEASPKTQRGGRRRSSIAAAVAATPRKSGDCSKEQSRRQRRAGERALSSHQTGQLDGTGVTHVEHTSPYAYPSDVYLTQRQTKAEMLPSVRARASVRLRRWHAAVLSKVTPRKKRRRWSRRESNLIIDETARAIAAAPFRAHSIPSAANKLAASCTSTPPLPVRTARELAEDAVIGSLTFDRFSDAGDIFCPATLGAYHQVAGKDEAGKSEDEEYENGDGDLPCHVCGLLVSEAVNERIAAAKAILLQRELSNKNICSSASVSQGNTGEDGAMPFTEVETPSQQPPRCHSAARTPMTTAERHARARSALRESRDRKLKLRKRESMKLGHAGLAKKLAQRVHRNLRKQTMRGGLVDNMTPPSPWSPREDSARRSRKGINNVLHMPESILSRRTRRESAAKPVGSPTQFVLSPTQQQRLDLVRFARSKVTHMMSSGMDQLDFGYIARQWETNRERMIASLSGKWEPELSLDDSVQLCPASLGARHTFVVTDDGCGGSALPECVQCGVPDWSQDAMKDGSNKL